MRVAKYTLATAELFLIFPAVLFMAALFLRNVQPQQFEPAHTAAQIVTWYALRPRLGLWVLLIGFPLAVLGTGILTLWRSWSRESELQSAIRQACQLLKEHTATLMVAAATLTATGVLFVVGLHLISD